MDTQLGAHKDRTEIPVGSKEWGESRWLWTRDPTSLSLGLTCEMGLRTLRAPEGHTEVNRALHKSKLPPSPRTLPGAGCGTPELWPARHGDPDQGSHAGPTLGTVDFALRLPAFVFLWASPPVRGWGRACGQEPFQEELLVGRKVQRPQSSL